MRFTLRKEGDHFVALDVHRIESTEIEHRKGARVERAVEWNAESALTVRCGDASADHAGDENARH